MFKPFFKKKINKQTYNHSCLSRSLETSQQSTSVVISTVKTFLHSAQQVQSCIWPFTYSYIWYTRNQEVLKINGFIMITHSQQMYIAHSCSYVSTFAIFLCTKHTAKFLSPLLWCAMAFLSNFKKKLICESKVSILENSHFAASKHVHSNMQSSENLS